MLEQQSALIEALERRFRDRLPAAVTRIDRPQKDTGIWFLDVELDGHQVIVQWQQGRGFGVSSPSSAPGYGEGADEVYGDEETAWERVVSRLLQRQHTS